MVTIKRFKTGSSGTFGKLFYNGIQLACTAERPYTGDFPCIPVGTYHVISYDSPSKGYKVWLFTNVPNRDFIEIHIGNFPLKDSKGCILVGDAIGKISNIPAVLNSVNTFAKLKEKLPATFDLTIEWAGDDEEPTTQKEML